MEAKRMFYDNLTLTTAKTQTTHPVLTDSSAPPAGTLTVIASNVLARGKVPKTFHFKNNYGKVSIKCTIVIVSRDQSPQSAASGVRQTIFKQESINSTNSHNSMGKLILF